jgi:hypothetical protein
MEINPWGVRVGMTYDSTNGKRGRIGTSMGVELGLLPGIKNGEDPGIFERPLFVEVTYGIVFFGG